MRLHYATHRPAAPRFHRPAVCLATCGILLAGLVWPAVSAHAQTVRTLVLVRGQDTMPPLVTPAGVSGRVAELPGFLVLLGVDGREVARTPVNSVGLMALLAPAPGRYRLGVERIGYETTTSRLFEVGLDRVVDATIDFPTERVALGDFAPDPNACVALPENEAAETLWSEARKALRASNWSDGGSRYAFVSTEYDRSWDAQGRVIDEETRTSGGKPRFGSSDPQRRYVVESVDGLIVYYAPTPEVLFDASFTNTHCFSLVRDPAEHPGQVGVGFAPSRAPTATDVRGTLWIDEASLDLRAVEWEYTDVSVDGLGGAVELGRVSPARWSVQRWSARVPRLQLRDGERSDEGFRELGGEIASVTPIDPSAIGEMPPVLGQDDQPPVVWAAVAEEALRLTLARRISFGIKGGVGRATISGSEVDTEQRSAVHVGAFVALAPARIMALQIEGVYARRGAEDVSGRLDVDYIDIPVLAVFHTGHLGRFRATPRIAVGPTISYRLRCRVHDAVQGTSNDCGDDTQTLAFGLTVGAGVHLHLGSQTVLLEAAYLHGLTNANREADHNFDFTNRDLSLSVGLSFPLAGGL